MASPRRPHALSCSVTTTIPLALVSVPDGQAAGAMLQETPSPSYLGDSAHPKWATARQQLGSLSTDCLQAELLFPGSESQRQDGYYTCKLPRAQKGNLAVPGNVPVSSTSRRQVSLIDRQAQSAFSRRTPVWYLLSWNLIRCWGCLLLSSHWPCPESGWLQTNQRALSTHKLTLMCFN